MLLDTVITFTMPPGYGAREWHITGWSRVYTNAHWF